MWDVLGQVTAAAAVRGYRARVLSPAETSATRARVLKKFSNTQVWPTWIWEHLVNSVAVHNPAAWRWIGEFVGEQPAIVMFNPMDELSSVILERGSCITDLIGDCFSFEFYVTDPEVTYFLSFDHHDYLRASGAATSWLEGHNGSTGTTPVATPAEPHGQDG